MANLIAAYSGQRVMSGMLDRIVAQEVERREHESEAARKAEMDALKAQVDIRRDRETAYWREKIAQADAMYGGSRRPGPVGRVVWGLVGLIVEKVIAPIERGE